MQGDNDDLLSRGGEFSKLILVEIQTVWHVL